MSRYQWLALSQVTKPPPNSLRKIISFFLNVEHSTNSSHFTSQWPKMGNMGIILLEFLTISDQLKYCCRIFGPIFFHFTPTWGPRQNKNCWGSGPQFGEVLHPLTWRKWRKWWGGGGDSLTLPDVNGPDDWAQIIFISVITPNDPVCPSVLLVSIVRLRPNYTELGSDIKTSSRTPF